MTPRERFIKILDFNMNLDRIPRVEFSPWWDKTLNRWKKEGLPNMNQLQSLKYFGFDPILLIYANAAEVGLPHAEYNGGPIIGFVRTYDDIRKYLYTDALIDAVALQAHEHKERHDNGDIILRIRLDGFFWFPRVLLGIEPHFYAFYDEPELIHRINNDLADFHIKIVDAVCSVLKPDMAGFAEDMSYNHGPMLSKDLYNKFLLPYYRKVIPHIKKQGIKVFVDSDGNIAEMIPWLLEAGIEGAYPLERQAGMDLNKIRAMYPRFLLISGYDKMVMSLGEKSMRAEFERLLPVMKSGGYIPSVDHQTPPEVSLNNYRTYIKLLEEYTRKAVL